MPWQETYTVELREALVMAILGGEASVADLCRRAGVSRKTAYKWVERFKAGGKEALVDTSRARHTQEHAVGDEVMDMILEARGAHPTWGVKKILPHLAKRYPEVEMPSQSTAGEILQRAGLTVPQSRVCRRRGALNPGTLLTRPNQVWTIDFKGQFRLGCGRECYPLTVVDAFSRFILCIDGKYGTHAEGVFKSMRRLFREYGKPERVKSDNGSPFAGTGLGRVSQVSVWKMSQTIDVEYIAPGKPGQNGSHERMHRTLKAEATRPPAATLAGQQRRFSIFRRSYNEERPHEAIGQKTPSELYVASPRQYRGDVPEEDVYPGHWERREVGPDGKIKWKDELVFIAQPLESRRIGLVETADRVWQIYYQRTLLGLLDERGAKVVVRDAYRQTPPLRA